MGYYDDRKQMEDLGILLIIFVILIPVIPAGDIGLYFAKQISGGKPIIILNIIFWVISIYFYYKFLLYVAQEFLYSLHYSIIILLAYIQGIILAFMIHDTKFDKFSSIVVKFVTAIFNFLTSPA